MKFTKMSEIHEFSLTMLDSFDKLCKEHNIRYCIAYGALIGYARHNNLIPWDDDIDVLMMREDYDKLLSLSKTKIDPEYELIIPVNEDAFFDFVPRYSSKLHCSERTDIVSMDDKIICENIGIDIFVLDNSYTGFKQSIRVKKLLWTYLKAIKYRNVKVLGSHRKIKKILSHIAAGRNSLSAIIQKYEKISTENKNETGFVFASNSIPSELNIQYPSDWFSDLIEIEIRGHIYPAPRNYLKFITKCYPSFPDLPPENDRKPQHYKVEMDETY